MIRRLLFAIGFCAFMPLANGMEQSEIHPWSEDVFHQIEKEFGSAAKQRMKRIHELIHVHRSKPVEEKLQLVNNELNHVPWISDRQKYHAEDYWATPLETIATFGGDCEDIAIAKYVVLRAMGVPEKHMELLYGKMKKTGEAHMVLVYAPNLDRPLEKQTLLVLGSIDHTIRRLRDRKDLIPVYLMDFDDDVAVITRKNAQRKVLSPWHHVRAKKLDKVKEAIRKENAKYQQYNGGRPLY